MVKKPNSLLYCNIRTRGLACLPILVTSTVMKTFFCSINLIGGGRMACALPPNPKQKQSVCVLSLIRVFKIERLAVRLPLEGFGLSLTKTQQEMQLTQI